LCSVKYTDKDGNVSKIVKSAGELNTANSEDECFEENWEVEIDAAEITKIQIILENEIQADEGEEISQSKILFDHIEVCI